MITDDERREVARKLRFNAGTAPYMNMPDNFAREVFRAAMDESTADYRAAINRLADLIEPPTQCPFYHSDRHYCSAYDDVVDRDALLKLADELEQETGSVCGVCMGKTASRIRKALGVEK